MIYQYQIIVQRFNDRFYYTVQARKLYWFWWKGLWQDLDPVLITTYDGATAIIDSHRHSVYMKEGKKLMK